MVRNFWILLFVCFSLTRCQSQGEQKKVQLPDFSLLPNHPRVLLLKGEEESIRNKIAANGTWNSIHTVIIRESDRMLSKQVVEYKLKGKRLLDVSVDCHKRVFYLSYAWRLTKDKKYLDKAEQELLAASAFPDWNPSHFLDVAEMTMALAIGYDWLFDSLSESTRKVVKEAIKKKGLEPSLLSEYNWWLESGSNWNQVCNASMVYGALAIAESEPVLARKIIERAIATIQVPMKEYEPDGAYAEGYMYWGYGTTFNVYLLSALENVFGPQFGLTENTAFLKTGEYLLHMIGPSGESFNYSDGGSSLTLNPAMFWLAERTKDYSILHAEKEIIRKHVSASFNLPALMIWGMGVDFSAIPEPEKLIWTGGGKNPVAMMRSSWKQDAIYLGLKAGSPNNGHGHMDVGSFVIDAMGVRWAMDLGGQKYSAVEAKGIDLWSFKQKSQRWQLFRYNNLAHNTLAFNNELQLVDGIAPIKSYSQDQANLSATLDLTSLYSNYVKKALRAGAIINKECVVIRDEITLSGNSATIRWTMVTLAEVKLVDDQTAELFQLGKKMVMKVLEPAGVKITTWSAIPTQDYDEPNPGVTRVGFEIQLPANQVSKLTVVMAPGSYNFNDLKLDFPPLDKLK